MKRFLTFFLLLILAVSKPVYAKEVQMPRNLYAKAAVLMDAKSGRVLFGKEQNQVLAMASTTKIMTCILALEIGTRTDVVTVTQNAATQPKVHLGMEKDEQFYLNDLLYSLMLESHNDSAVAIAEHLSGSVEEFAKKMNEKALEIGCEHSYFITPNGLDATDESGMHSTTAKDLATIMSYCIYRSPQREAFLEITGAAKHSFSDLAKRRTFQCYNRNSFLNMKDGAISGKTGYTNQAGYCYVGAVEQDGELYVVALLACGWPNHKNYKWEDTKQLMEYAITNYEYRDVYTSVELPRLLVKNGVSENSRLYGKAYATLKVEGEKNLELLLRTDEQVKVQTELDDMLKAPIKKGHRVGNVNYILNDEIVAKYPIVVEKDVEEKDLEWYFLQLFEMYLGI